MKYVPAGLAFAAVLLMAGLFVAVDAYPAELELEVGMGPTIAGETEEEKVARTQFRLGHVFGHRTWVAGAGFTNAGTDAELMAADVYIKGFISGYSGSDTAVFARLTPGSFFFTTDGSKEPEYIFRPALALGVQTNQDGRFGLVAEAENVSDFEAGEFFSNLTLYGKLMVYFGHSRGS